MNPMYLAHSLRHALRVALEAQPKHTRQGGTRKGCSSLTCPECHTAGAFQLHRTPDAAWRECKFCLHKIELEVKS